jgi:hypothetical protein
VVASGEIFQIQRLAEIYVAKRLDHLLAIGLPGAFLCEYREDVDALVDRALIISFHRAPVDQVHFRRQARSAPG